MAKKTWILCDIERDVYVEDLNVGPRDVEGAQGPFRVRKRTLRGGLRDGVDVVEVDNGTIRFTALLSRGMGLWRAWLADQEYGWQSPVRGPVHPKFVPLDAPNGIGWLHGFDELLVRCGLESLGAPQFNKGGILEYPLHGRSASLPAQRVELTIDGDSQEIHITGEVDEARLFGPNLRLRATYSTKLGSSTIRLKDEVTNRSAQTGAMELLYHINVGYPLVTAGARVHVPVKTLVPRTDHAASLVKSWNEYPAGTPGATESVYLIETVGDAQGNTRTLLESAHGDKGLGIAWRLGQLPRFALWKNPQADGDGYVTGLEPTINWPNPRRFEEEQGRVVKLSPGETRAFELELNLLGSAEAVAVERSAVERLATGVTPKIFDRPQSGWVEGK